MARIDKAWMIVRAIAGTALTGLKGVKFTGGSVVPSGTADADGVVCLPGTIAAGRPVGVMKAGEIIEFGGTAGDQIFAGPDGAVSASSSDGRKVGHTVEGDRLVVWVDAT